MFLGYIVCRCSVISTYDTCIAISHDKQFELFISTFRSVCAVPNTTVLCSPLMSCFPGGLLSYCLNNSEMVPVAPVITAVTF